MQPNPPISGLVIAAGLNLSVGGNMTAAYSSVAAGEILARVTQAQATP